MEDACSTGACTVRLICARYRRRYKAFQRVSRFPARDDCSHFIGASDSPWPLVAPDTADERVLASQAAALEAKAQRKREKGWNKEK